MGEAATQLKAVGAASEELHETAKQALEWVRVSEERVAKAEARSEELRSELKAKAMATLRKLGEEGRARSQVGARQAQGGRGAGDPGRGRPRSGRAEPSSRPRRKLKPIAKRSPGS